MATIRIWAEEKDCEKICKIVWNADQNAKFDICDVEHGCRMDVTNTTFKKILEMLRTMSRIKTGPFGQSLFVNMLLAIEGRVYSDLSRAIVKLQGMIEEET